MHESGSCTKRLKHCPTVGAIGISISLGCVLLWYVFSIGLTFYNKWLFGTYGLRYPLTVTSVHVVLNFLLSWVCRAALFRWNGKKRPVLSHKTFLYGVVPTGTSSALDIGLSNMAILYINITTYTICKSTSIIFLLLFAFLFRVEKPSFALLGVIVTISVGVMLFTYGGEAHYNTFGLLLIMTATLMAGLRWVLTQLLLQHRKFGLHNPIDTLYHVSPVMSIVLTPIALIFEGTSFFTSSHVFMGNKWSPYETFLIIAFGGTIAFVMNLSEFLLISRTSSVTLSVAGTVKEVVTICLSVVLFSETLDTMNIVGLLITIGGVAIYNVIKFREIQPGLKEASKTVHDRTRYTHGPEHDQSGNDMELLMTDGTRDKEDELFEMQDLDRNDKHGDEQY
eukprot:CFRG4646T1